MCKPSLIINTIYAWVIMVNVQGNIFCLSYRRSLQQVAVKLKNNKMQCFHQGWWWWWEERGSMYRFELFTGGGLPKLNQQEQEGRGRPSFGHFVITSMTYPEVFWGYHLYLKSLFLISREAPSPPFPPMVGAMTMKRNN